MVTFEGGRRLIGEQQFGRSDEGDGDRHPLAQAPRKLMRIGTVETLGIGNVDQPHRRQDPFAPGLAGALGALQGFADLRAHGHDRVERVERILEHHADVPAADLPHFPLPQPQQVAAREVDGAAANVGIGRQELDERAYDRALARAGLPHQAEDLARTHVEGDAVDDVERAAAPAIGDGEAAHAENAARGIALAAAVPRDGRRLGRHACRSRSVLRRSAHRPGAGNAANAMN